MANRLKAWLRRKVSKAQQDRRQPSPGRLAGTRATRQQFFEATRNAGVIILATCFTAGWIITNPAVNTDNMEWGVLYGLGLITIGCVGYGISKRNETSDR